MNFTMVVVPKNTKINDEVVIIGKQLNDEITLSELADWWNTFELDITVNINWSVPRIYKYE